MTIESLRAIEPMCALDPLLLIPRIEYVKEIHDCVLAKAEEYCLVILDMKNFHNVNDVYGYDVGDQVIERFIFSLRKCLPPGSISLRFRHGDEFLFFVPKSTAQAQSLFKSFRESCEATPALTIDGQDIFVSYRFAAMKLTRSGENVRALLARAEKALREVKGSGTPRL
jgi:diguanylate cyclase